MKSSWQTEILALLRKEFSSEMRSKSGIMTAALFGVIVVVAISIAAFDAKIGGGLASGLVWVALLFSSVVALPRTFVAEEELGTGDLLRLIARPHVVFWGKALFNLVLMLVTGAMLSVLFFVFTGLSIPILWLYGVCLFGGCAAFSGAVTLCGALVAHASNRAALAGTVAIPLLLPLVFLGVTGMSVALGEGQYMNGVYACIGIVSYAVLTYALGPYLFVAVWKN